MHFNGIAFKTKHLIMEFFLKGVLIPKLLNKPLLLVLL